MLFQLCKKLPVIVVALFVLLGCLVNRDEIWHNYGTHINYKFVVMWWVLAIFSTMALIFVWA